MTTCTSCTTPLSSTDVSCPTCGAASPFVARPTGSATGRALLLGTAPRPAPAGPPPTPLGKRPARWAGRARAGAATTVPTRGGPTAAGTITGAVTTADVPTRSTGRRVVTGAAALVTAAAAVVLVVVGGADLTVAVLLGQLPVLLLVVGLLAVCWLQVAGLRPARRATNRIEPVGADQEHTTPAHRFRITEVSGRIVDCTLTGTLTGGELCQGQVVEVYGRPTRHGPVRAREVLVLADRTTVRARPGLRWLLARGAPAVAVLLATGCVLGVAVVLVTR